MSKEAIKWADNQKIPDATLMAVLRAVAWHADKGSGECRQPQSSIASRSLLRPRAVKYALDVLAVLEIIDRKPRSKGRYGRASDLITLAMHRDFDVSRAAISAIRKSSRLSAQGARGAHSEKTSKVHEVQVQGARGAGEYNTVNPEESLSVGITSVGNEGTYTGEGIKTLPADQENQTGSNVVLLRVRGAL